ncbi:class I SAM-dependent methyltransferase [Candidatus Woesearchaeota archaeon]|nr:class I SAM-dependent methyltransferase [Candidatus Woesearchaeota archaeon]
MFTKEIVKQLAVDCHWLERPSNIPRLKQYLQPGSLLEVGCAQGKDTEELAKLYKVTALDINPEFLRAAAQRNPGTCFIRGDIHSLPFPDNSFENIVCLNTLFYTDTEKSVPELIRVLKRDGIAAISVDERTINLETGKPYHEQDMQRLYEMIGRENIVAAMYNNYKEPRPFLHEHHHYDIVFRK